MNCPICKTLMKPLATSLYCPNDCDRPTTQEPPKYPDTWMDFKEHSHPNPLKKLVSGTIILQGSILTLGQNCPLGRCGYFLIHAERIPDPSGSFSAVGYCGGQKLPHGEKAALFAKHIWSLIPREP